VNTPYKMVLVRVQKKNTLISMHLMGLFLHFGNFSRTPINADGARSGAATG